MITGIVLTVALVGPNAATDLRGAVGKGLAYLAGKQKKDGSWDSGREFTFQTSTTAYAGLALLMEGSTPQHGAYSENLRRAVAWFEKAAQPNGLLVPADDQTALGREVPWHAAALLFLASAYDVDDDAPRRKRVEKVLTAAVRYAAEAQTRRGGWGYSVPQPGNNYDDVQQTAAVLHALVAAERAGIAVPRAVVSKGQRYFADATNRDGGVVYSLVNDPPRNNNGQAMPTALAAAAVVGSDHRPGLNPLWVAFLHRQSRVPPAPKIPTPNDANSYLHHQYLAVARVANALGEDGHRTLDPTAATHLRWSAYRGQLFAYLKATQTADGGWADNFIGPTYSTGLVLITLQLDNNYLPAFSR